MEDIRLDSVRLIATDDTSKEIIERLRSDGVYGKEDTECQLINMVFVASAAGVVPFIRNTIPCTDTNIAINNTAIKNPINLSTSYRSVPNSLVPTNKYKNPV